MTLTANAQQIQLYDVILLARGFGVSRMTAIYRLKNLRLISRAELDGLLDLLGFRDEEMDDEILLPDD